MTSQPNALATASDKSAEVFGSRFGRLIPAAANAGAVIHNCGVWAGLCGQCFHTYWPSSEASSGTRADKFVRILTSRGAVTDTRPAPRAHSPRGVVVSRDRIGRRGGTPLDQLITAAGVSSRAVGLVVLVLPCLHRRRQPAPDKPATVTVGVTDHHIRLREAGWDHRPANSSEHLLTRQRGQRPPRRATRLHPPFQRRIHVLVVTDRYPVHPPAGDDQVLIHYATCPFRVHRSTITKIVAYLPLRVHDNTQR